jgi:simple sugar transport system permease protein
MLAGLVAGAVVGTALPGGTPAVIAVPLCLLAAAAAGGAIGAATGWLRAARGAHEVITGIMLTAVIEGAVLWIGNAGMFVSGTTRTHAIAGGAELAGLGLGGSGASIAVVIAALVAGGVWLVRARGTWGARWIAVGASPDAAETMGVPVKTVRIAIMAVSGAIAGLVATALVMGHQHAFEEGLGRGYGYLGLAVGLLGRRHPGGVVVAALILGFLGQGGLMVNDMVPKELTELLIGFAVLAVAIAAPTTLRLELAKVLPRHRGGRR